MTNDAASSNRRWRLCLVAGARPNFMKIAPLMRAFSAAGTFEQRLVHTGQHYDAAMSDVFFDDLGIPAPDRHLDVGSGSHALQTARVMSAFEPVLLEDAPDAVIVVGDVNSTLAATLVAAKLRIPVAHVEAGLRSGDRDMPEELNRIVTDALADLLYTTEAVAATHLRAEGRPTEAIRFVGHVMVDNLMHQVARLERAGDALPHQDLKRKLGRRYGVVTLHRPSNVDDPVTLSGLCTAMAAIAEDLPLVFPVHPRTRAVLERAGIALGPRVHMLPPLSHLAFLNLWRDAELVLTDSGGLQEETTALGVPCVTLRENTERPVTVELGSNVLAGTAPDAIVCAARAQLARGRVLMTRPPLWDGRAAERIAADLNAWLGARHDARRSAEARRASARTHAPLERSTS